MVATYNGQRVIKKCVESLLNTDYHNKEVIVVDDGSIDNTHKILSAFGNRIRILSKQRGGVGDSRNFGLRNTNANLIAITDDDCVVEPGWIKEAIGYFFDPAVAAVTGQKKYKITNLVSTVRAMEYHIRFQHRHREANSVECPVVLFRRDALLKVAGFTCRSRVGGEDTDIGYKLREANFKIIYEPKMTVHHDPEEDFGVYLKRNFRNGVAYVWVFWTRSKRQSMTDDFFPLSLKLQPLLAIALLICAALIPYKSTFIKPAVILFLAIPFSFLPLLKEVVRIKGYLSFFPAVGILLLRNIIWAGAFFVGWTNLMRKVKKD